MVTIIKDKEAIYDTEKYDVVLLGLSTHNVLMGNFQGKMAVKYPIIEKAYYNTPVGDIRKLGKRITIDDLGDEKPKISLMFICTYPSRKKSRPNCFKWIYAIHWKGFIRRTSNEFI